MAEISSALGVAKSTVSVWVRDVRLDKDAMKKLLDRTKDARARSAVTLKRKKSARIQEAGNRARVKFKEEMKHELQRFLLLSMLYDGEGGKGERSTMEFTNSDPKTIRLFLTLLRERFAIDESKFRVVMHLHAYHKEDEMRDFWMNVTDIPCSRFLKTYQKNATGKGKKEGYMGCVQIKYFDVSIKRELLWGKSLLIERLGL